MNRSRLIPILAVSLSVVVVCVMLALHFLLPYHTATPSGSSSSGQSSSPASTSAPLPPAPWAGNGEVETRIG